MPSPFKITIIGIILLNSFPTVFAQEIDIALFQQSIDTTLFQAKYWNDFHEESTDLNSLDSVMKYLPGYWENIEGRKIIKGQLMEARILYIQTQKGKYQFSLSGEKFYERTREYGLYIVYPGAHFLKMEYQDHRLEMELFTMLGTGEIKIEFLSQNKMIYLGNRYVRHNKITDDLD